MSIPKDTKAGMPICTDDAIVDFHQPRKKSKPYKLTYRFPPSPAFKYGGFRDGCSLSRRFAKAEEAVKSHESGWVSKTWHILMNKVPPERILMNTDTNEDLSHLLT